MEDWKKPNKITEIVKLHQILKKWRRLANNSSSSSSESTTNNKSIKFLKRTLSLSNNNSATSGDNNVPKGYLAVCVGEELKKFIIPTEYLSHQAFGMLLREAEEEFGFQQEGILRIPCEVQVFMSILKVIEKKKNVVLFTKEFSYTDNDGIATCCSSETPLNQPCQPHSPMCR